MGLADVGAFAASDHAGYQLPGMWFTHEKSSRTLFGIYLDRSIMAVGRRRRQAL
ncbi:hypothetical protein CVCC1112_4019 [Paenarthrobacter nicotinovorans]|nr:hypothetical protein CVCC1112_4019 [Paenarthrobacter nicotinovorans]